MVKARITRSDGTQIIIDGSPEEVRGVIDYLSSGKKEQHKERKIKRKKLGSKLSISDLIDELKEEEFFDKPQGLVDIKNALKERGHIYSITTLSGVILRKVRKRELGRIKEDKKWKYVKR